MIENSDENLDPTVYLFGGLAAESKHEPTLEHPSSAGQFTEENKKRLTLVGRMVYTLLTTCRSGDIPRQNSLPHAYDAPLYIGTDR